MAVRERADNVERTLKSLGMSVPVYYDDDRAGPWANALKAWTRPKSGATHQLVLQDDIVICRNFVKTVERLCELRPNHPLSLFTMRKGSADAIERGTQWVQVEYGVWGQATVLPTSLIPKMLRWNRENVHEDYRMDDSRISLWMEANRIPAFAPAPNIVDHLDGHSVVGHKTPLSRKSRSFIGEETDGLSVDWTRGLDTPLIERLGNLHKTYSKHLIMGENNGKQQG